VTLLCVGLFAVFWLSFGMLQLPTLGLAAAYSPTGSAAEGLASPKYNAVVALYLIVWGFALFTFFIFTLKTNAVIAAIFFFVTLGSWVLAGAYFKVASGDYVMAGHLQTVQTMSVSTKRMSADGLPGWRSSAVHCGTAGVVYDIRDHGGRDAFRYVAAPVEHEMAGSPDICSPVDVPSPRLTA